MTKSSSLTLSFLSPYLEIFTYLFPLLLAHNSRAMPTFTSIALDGLLEPRPSKSVDKTMPNSRSIPQLKPIPKSKPAPNSKLERRNSEPTVEKKVQHPQISPAFYATPKAIPLPDSPTSFSPSPYIINHKRRGPRLLKSFSEDDITSHQKALVKEKINDNTKNEETDIVKLNKDVSVAVTIVNPVEEKHVDGVRDWELGSSSGEFRIRNREHSSSDLNNGLAGETGSNYLSSGLSVENDSLNVVQMNSERDSVGENFFDPRDSMSFTSNMDGEDNNGAESALNLATPMLEFYDAWEELSDGGPQLTPSDIEPELRERRLSVLVEIEKQKRAEETLSDMRSLRKQAEEALNDEQSQRKQAEEALNDMQSQWQRIRQQLSIVGLTIPADLTAAADGDQLDFDYAADLFQQVSLARFVSQSIGRGIAKAEAETEMEAQIEAKNFEIARLWDRIHYYETVNREMYQRNQEAVEMARQDRQRKKRRQRWVWGSIAAAITLGSAALVWTYLPAGKGSQAHDRDSAAK